MPSAAASVVLDTGPLVALLDADETHHAWAFEQFQQLRPPLLTCEAVLTEACFLITRTGADPSVVTELVERGVLTVANYSTMRRSRLAGSSHGTAMYRCLLLTRVWCDW
jgi:predicted nucleic acid-binding protein